jgi:hypothetical protein
MRDPMNLTSASVQAYLADPVRTLHQLQWFHAAVTERLYFLGTGTPGKVVHSNEAEEQQILEWVKVEDNVVLLENIQDHLLRRISPMVERLEAEKRKTENKAG